VKVISPNPSVVITVNVQYMPVSQEWYLPSEYNMIR
jgi:hypothetical protein